MSDLIKRQNVIDILYKCTPFDSDGIKLMERLEERINAIPSADRPRGEWIDKGGNLWGCSNCGMKIYSESEQDRNEFHKWCSRCGAQMDMNSSENPNNSTISKMEQVGKE